jgi:hypothetical protein
MAQIERDTLVLQVGGWAWGWQPTPGKKLYIQKTSEMPRMGLINRRRPGCKEKELIFGTLALLRLRLWRRNAENEWRRLMREAKARKGL